MNVVGSRVDALYLAYRVELAPETLGYLKQRHREATKHGACSVRWGSIVGSMGFSSRSSTWHVETARYQIQIFEKGPGADVTPEGDERCGWTVEIVWDAQELANMGDTKPAVDEGKRIAADLGRVLESRLRRFDLCADVAGFQIEAGDSDRLVRRSRAKLDMFVRVHENSKGVTGVTVCPGGVVMARLYDKREELAVRNVVDKTIAEETRWRAGGWDGDEPVTRVEFQIRGEAIKELGLRNPDAPVHPETGKVIAAALRDRVDAVWQRCLNWLRLVELTKDRKSECPEDPVWLALRAVKFVRKSVVAALRFRVRRHASVEQTFGCALSVVGATLGLEPVKPWHAVNMRDNDDAKKALHGHVGGIFARAALVVATELEKKWKGPAKALEHTWTVHDAARARFGDVIATALEPPLIASSA